MSGAKVVEFTKRPGVTADLSEYAYVIEEEDALTAGWKALGIFEQLEDAKLCRQSLLGTCRIVRYHRIGVLA